MKNIGTYIGTVTDLTRLKHSLNGNPRFSFVIDGYHITTAVDSSHGYEIQNYEGKKVVVTAGMHYGKLTLNTIERV